jgi:hypothetical protein
MGEDFDEDELNEIYEAIEAEEQAQEAGVAQPRFRATHRNGRLTVLPHHDGLAEHSAVLTMLNEPTEGELTIADLGESEIAGKPGGWEMTVTVLTLGHPSPQAEHALVEWATDVGYRRVWLPDRVVTCQLQHSFLSGATAQCETCGQTWHQSGRSFWTHVAKRRSFPTYCLICGADLASWRIGRMEDKRRKRSYGASDPHLCRRSGAGGSRQ